MSRLLAGLWLALLCHAAWAQTDDIVTEFKRLSPTEESSLRVILAEPVPIDALSSTLQRHFSAKEVAAQKLAELGPLLALYRQWTVASPTTVNLNNFSNELKRAGETDEALRVRKEAVDREKPGINQEMFRKNLAGDLFNLGRVRDAQDTLAVIHQKLQALQTQNWQGRNRLDLLRVQAETQALEAMIHNRFGAQTKAVEAASHSVDSAREALKRAQARPGTDRNDADTMRAGSTLASSLAQKKSALQAAGQYGEAEETLREFMRLAKAVDLQPRYLATLYQSAGTLRQALREFTQAERYFRKADQVLASLGYTPLSPARTGVASWTVASLEGQHRWADALAELDRLDELAKDDLAVSKRIRFPRVRGYAYLHAPLGAAARLTAAVELFRGMSADAAKWYPAHHFLVAQANGLQGVALWRTGDAQSKTKALVLLKKAVLDYMVPDNIELETADLGKDIRDLIFATYLEAVFATPGDNPMEAMGPADWVRGGMVQEALADAAVRASATDPALADLVRKDQDAKNEIEALRKYLANDGGSADAVAQMRNRISALDSARKKLQVETKAKFPNFDRLLRPTPPGAIDLAKDLGKDEALVMLLPTEDAVFVWAISNTGGSAGGSASARVPLSKDQLKRLVQGARQTLDFNAMGGQIRPFDAAAASELYQRLLTPVKGVTAGKTHLIVAAGGVLGQIPFGVLLTQPTSTQPMPTLTADAPWLIRQAAITHVPSLSAWTAVKQLAKAASAPESLAAWGDPQFAGKAPAALTRASPQSPHNAASLELDQEDTGTALRYADIPALPETRDELLAIARALQADPQRDLHLGEGATKASVLQSSRSGELLRKKVIAFATHGLMAGDLPKLTQPALALAGTGLEATDPLGALLTLDEVLGLKLNADWVVLSACNTAASDGKGEEALSGLARGFFYAGSRSLLVTHWAVESESAKQLTTATFDHYTQHPQARKAESLRQAMLKVMANPKFSHPAFWAPYALVGDGGR